MLGTTRRVRCAKILDMRADAMQGPAGIGAAIAIKDVMKDYPFKLVIYGTPAEETLGGKIIYA